jgi:hypothetical protein
VLKRDNGSNLNQQAVDEVLARYWVLPLNSPPHYPPYNGGTECAVRELKAPLVEKILAHGQTPESQVQAWAEVLAHDLNHHPRGCLDGRIACRVFQEGKPRQIVSPLRDRGIVSRRCVETIVEEDRGKQADIEGEVAIELVDDLPGSEASFVGVGTSQVEVELIERGLGEELRTTAKGFQVVELVFDQAVNGLDIALIGVSGGRDPLVLRAEVGDGLGEVRTRAVGLQLADEFAAVVPS